MKSLLLRTSALTLAVLIPTLGIAEKADRQQKMVIQADDLHADGINQVQVYSGNVVVTKGSLILRGAKLEIREDAQGYQYATVTSSPSQLAFFRQKREGLDEFFEAQAQTIEYDGRADTVKLLQKARLQRLRGASLADEYSGALITYNNLSDQFTVSGKTSPSGVGNSVPADRLRSVRVPVAAASAAGNPKDSSAAPPLRPSTALSGNKP